MNDVSVFGIVIPRNRVAAFSERNYKEFMAYLFGCIDVEIEQVNPILFESLWLTDSGFEHLYERLKERVAMQKKRYYCWYFDDDIDDDFDLWDDFEEDLIERFTKWVEVYDFPEPDEIKVFDRIFSISYDFYLSLFYKPNMFVNNTIEFESSAQLSINEYLQSSSPIAAERPFKNRLFTDELEEIDKACREFFSHESEFSKSLYTYLFSEFKPYVDDSKYQYAMNNEASDASLSDSTFLPVSGHEYYLGIDITKLDYLNSEQGKQLISDLFLDFSIPSHNIIEVLEREYLCKSITLVMNRFDCQIGTPGSNSAKSALQLSEEQTYEMPAILDMDLPISNSKDVESLSACHKDKEQLARIFAIARRISDWSDHTATIDEDQLENLLNMIDVQSGDVLCAGYLLYEFGFDYALGINPDHVIQFLRRFHVYLDEDDIDALLELYKKVKTM